MAAGGVLLCAVLCAWAIWQPEASDQDSTDALELVGNGHADAGLAKAKDAHDADPLSPRPLLVKASAQQALGRKTDARKTLEGAVIDFPGDPQTWIALADYQLTTLDQPASALNTLRGALYLDPKSKAGQSLFHQALTRRGEKAAADATARRKRALREAKLKARRAKRKK